MMKKIHRMNKQRALYIIFGIYMFVLISILIFKFPTGMVSNAIKNVMAGAELHRSPMQLVPFKTIIEYAGNVHSLTDWFIKNLACNIIMFMPLGILLPLMLENGEIRKKGSIFFMVLLAGFILSTAIEIIQYISCLGLCDIDDVILNTMGSVMGYFLLCGYHRIRASS